MCKDIVKFLVLETKRQGITKTADRSGLKRRTITSWVYYEALPSFANAVKWANALGFRFNMSKEDIVASLKTFGLIKSAEVSGIKIRTIRSWLYAGIEPPLDKIEKITTAIGKPLELIKVGGCE